MFGYSRIPPADQVMLLGLYQGLIKHLDTKIEEFVEAVEKGRVPELVKEKFTTLPESAGGGYYPWFLQMEKQVFP
ncbi:hypothetical protein HK104_005680 [Borealophlyctis nickersoniae]|nr:hypothetical protein HK104_005680 [Borealophlyctis nickersoniae]